MKTSVLKTAVVIAAFSYPLLLLTPGFLYPGLYLAPDPVTPLVNTVVFSSFATVLAFPAALILAFYASKRGLAWITPLLTFSTAIPHTALGLLLLPLFTRLGFIDTAPAIIISMIVVSLPIGIGVLTSTFSSAQRSLDDFLQPLGLSDPQIIWMHLRAIPSGIVVSSLLMWLRNFSELGVFLIVANRPQTVGIYLFSIFNQGGAAASILYAILFGLIGLAFSFLLYLVSRGARVD
ncbi:MAG: ABC transporter permease subunit [Candidatus Caldarchaeum sp.]